jgi:hypothetical protein
MKATTSATHHPTRGLFLNAKQWMKGTLIALLCSAWPAASVPWAGTQSLFPPGPSAQATTAATVDAAPAVTDLAIDPFRFYLEYTVNDTTTPTYQVVPTTTGAFPFNTADTPFLLPCEVQESGGQISAHLLSAAAPVYWKGIVRFIHEDGTVIVSHGYSGMHTFDSRAFPVTPILAPGTSADAGYISLSKVNVFRDEMFQPDDLGEDTPVRMELTVLPFADAQHMHPIVDSRPANNVVNIWVMRVGCP